MNWKNFPIVCRNQLILNVATREQLEQFPFLSDIQIEHLLAYI